MTRAKPFSGKQKKDQLKAKKERKRIEHSLEENDDQLSLYEKRKMAREIIASNSNNSGGGSRGSSGSTTAMKQQQQQKSRQNNNHQHHNNHHKHNNNRINRNRKDKDSGKSDTEDEDDLLNSDTESDNEMTSNSQQEESSENNDNESFNESNESQLDTEDDKHSIKFHQQRGRNGKPNLITIFEKESREEIEERKEKAKLPINLKFRETPWSVLDEHLGDDSEYIDIPKRPNWSFEFSPDRVKQKEREMFNNWLNQIVMRYDRQRLNYFEQNLEVWRQLWRVSERSDLVLLITDARYPLFHFPPALYHYITQDLKKPMLLVLNKIDLVDPRIIDAWKTYFTTKYPHLKVICFSSFKAVRDDDPNADPTDVNRLRKFKKGRKRYENAEGKQQLIDIIKSFNIEKKGLNLTTTTTSTLREDEKEEDEDSINESEDDDDDSDEDEDEDYEESNESNIYQPDKPNDNVITIGMVGHPNVGKSSLINGLMGRKVVSTSRTPGHTKHFQTIFLTKDIQLCDCPGLVFPALDRPKSLQILCGLFPIAQVREPFSAIRYLAERVAVEKVYGLSNPNQDHSGRDTEWSPISICEAFALKRGYLIAKSGRADIHRAGLEILRDCVDGNVVISWPPPGLTKDQYTQIMSTSTINVNNNNNNNDSETATTTTVRERSRSGKKLKIKKKFTNMTMLSSDDEDEDEIQRRSLKSKRCSRKKKQQPTLHQPSSDSDDEDESDEEEVPTEIAKSGKNKKLSDKALEYQERLREKQMKGGNRRQKI